MKISCIIIFINVIIYHIEIYLLLVQQSFHSKYLVSILSLFCHNFQMQIKAHLKLLRYPILYPDAYLFFGSYNIIIKNKKK